MRHRPAPIVARPWRPNAQGYIQGMTQWASRNRWRSDVRRRYGFACARWGLGGAASSVRAGAGLARQAPDPATLESLPESLPGAGMRSGPVRRCVTGRRTHALVLARPGPVLDRPGPVLAW